MKIVVNDTLYSADTHAAQQDLLPVAEKMLTDPKNNWDGLRPALKIFLFPFRKKIGDMLQSASPESYVPLAKGEDMLVWILRVGSSCLLDWIEKQPMVRLHITLESVVDEDGGAALERVASVELVTSSEVATGNVASYSGAQS